MIIDIAIFAIMAYFYVPFVSDNQSELDNDNEKPFQMEPIKTLKSDDDNWTPICPDVSNCEVFVTKQNGCKWERMDLHYRSNSMSSFRNRINRSTTYLRFFHLSSIFIIKPHSIYFPFSSPFSSGFTYLHRFYCVFAIKID